MGTTRCPQSCEYMVVPVPRVSEPSTSFLIDTLTQYWYTMKNQGLHRICLYSIPMEEPEEFISFARGEDKHFFFILKSGEDEPCAHVFLNNFSGASAHIHFCMLKHIQTAKQTSRVAECMFEYLKGCTLHNSKFGVTRPLVETLVAIMPLANRAATRYALRIGFEKMGVLEGACDMAYTGKLGDALVTKRRL